MHEHFIYLIYTPAMTNESPHVPSEVKTPQRNPRPTHLHHSEGTQLPREKERSGSPLLTRTLTDIRDEFSPRGREISTTILTNTTTDPVKILTSVLCVGSTGNVFPRSAYFVGLLVRGSALGLCSFSSLAQASTSHCFR